MPTRGGARIPGVGLVVEGPTEYAALPQIHRLGMLPSCPPLRVSNLNGVGESMEPSAIAKLVLPKVIAHQVAGRSHVVVCFDRERRHMSARTLATAVRHELRRLLVAKGRPTHGVRVVIADRAFEAWILADAFGLHGRRVFRVPPTFFCFEGELGDQGKLGTAELDRLLGRPYGKVRDGPRLFARVHLSEARKYGVGLRGSASLNGFLVALGI